MEVYVEPTIALIDSKSLAYGCRDADELGFVGNTNQCAHGPELRRAFPVSVPILSLGLPYTRSTILGVRADRRVRISAELFTFLMVMDLRCRGCSDHRLDLPAFTFKYLRGSPKGDPAGGFSSI